MNCKYCHGPCVKAGFQKDRTQKFFCYHCNKYQQHHYKNKACHIEVNQHIIRLVVEGMGIRNIARILHISITTVIDRIKRIAKAIKKPYNVIKNSIYELDELWTFVGRKTNEVWLMYAMDRKTKAIIDFKVGPRTKMNLQSLTDQIIFHEPQKVCTDGLNIYRTLVPENIHRIGVTNTKYIERNNLNIRTHLKRLSRKTICFSKSREMLEACLRIYFWRKLNERWKFVR